jgi:hypothetical protein
MTAARGRRSTRLTFTVHVSRDVGLEIQRLAQERKISLSACAAALLAESLRGPLDHQHAALVEAAIERSVARSLERLGDLSVRAALYGDEARRLSLQVLVNAVGVDRARAMRREVHSASYQRLLEPFEAPAPEGSSAWPAARTPS